MVWVLAEALARHSLNGAYCLGCDWQMPSMLSSWEDQHRLHQASVVAALPNIAIIELPEDDGETRIHGASALDGIYDLTVGVPRDRVSHRSLNDITSVESMEHLGLALLAAARAARTAGGQA
ncbi:hypothetical protein ASH04_06850 [Rhodococcus sp. Leaf233]|nr:hypothetical protein ASH04_06850 [Rhodococcus sp. Leaf233]